MHALCFGVEVCIRAQKLGIMSQPNRVVLLIVL